MKKNTHQRGFSCVQGLLILGLWACTPKTPAKQEAGEHNLNRVAVLECRCKAPWDSPNAWPSPAMVRQLAACLSAGGLTRNAWLDVRLPSGLRAATEGQIWHQNIRAALHRTLGLSMDRITTQDQDFPEGRTVEVVMRIFRSSPPECGSSPFSMGSAGSDPWPDLGCTSMVNLGLMIDDPRDLVTGRAPAVSPPVPPLASAVESAMSPPRNASAGGSGGSSGMAGSFGGSAGGSGGAGGMGSSMGGPPPGMSGPPMMGP